MSFMVSIELSEFPSPSPAEQESPTIIQTRCERHTRFRDHIVSCATCAQEYHDMCATGYELLRACLD